MYKIKNKCQSLVDRTDDIRQGGPGDPREVYGSGADRFARMLNGRNSSGRQRKRSKLDWAVVSLVQ